MGYIGILLYNIPKAIFYLLKGDYIWAEVSGDADVFPLWPWFGAQASCEITSVDWVAVKDIHLSYHNMGMS